MVPSMRDKLKVIAKAWMLERCPAEGEGGTRFGNEDIGDGSMDTETGKPCDCLDSLTDLLVLVHLADEPDVEWGKRQASSTKGAAG